MSVNYTPEQKSGNTITNFRFWCQKMLPAVYDDSLSYYEVLCKLTNYLNEVINSTNAMTEDVTSLYEAYNMLQGFVNDYFDNLSVQTEINNKLDTMASDGTLSALIQPLFDAYKGVIDTAITAHTNDIDVLKSRMNSFTTLPQGSTTGDAEMIDARVGFDGTPKIAQLDENGKLNLELQYGEGVFVTPIA